MSFGKNIDATNYAKSIFGDIIESAYISDEYNKADDIDYKGIVNFSNDEINLTDQVLLIIKLFNGKVFTIWSSEWGGLKKGDGTL